jgi:hypothetical protein
LCCFSAFVVVVVVVVGGGGGGVYSLSTQSGNFWILPLAKVWAKKELTHLPVPPFVITRNLLDIGFEHYPLALELNRKALKLRNYITNAI